MNDSNDSEMGFKCVIKNLKDYVHWNWMNYAMSADFLEYYAKKYPEPPENAFHNDLAGILNALRAGEKISLEIKKMWEHKPIAGDYQI